LGYLCILSAAALNKTSQLSNDKLERLHLRGKDRSSVLANEVLGYDFQENQRARIAAFFNCFPAEDPELSKNLSELDPEIKIRLIRVSRFWLAANSAEAI
jgi:hypothetical protein